MQFLKDIYYSVVGRRRRSKRFKVPSGNLECAIYNTKSGQRYYVRIDDLSEQGIGFLLKTAEFNIGDLVTILLSEPGVHDEPIQGRIVSQFIEYPRGQENLELAVYRYSANFLKPISRSKFNMSKEKNMWKNDGSR